jgi:hypothetical protein
MAHVAITVEGGLVSSDLLEQIAATPQDVQGQRAADFGVDGRLSDEIQKAFSDALAYWQAYQTRLARSGNAQPPSPAKPGCCRCLKSLGMR